LSVLSGGAQLGHPYWWDGIEWPDLDKSLPDRVDLLAIGAGYTGLSAAIAAHDAGAKVAVIDAGQPGQGASTRNGGMVGAHPRLSWEKLSGAFGSEAADALFAEAVPALNWMRSLIEHEGIECDLQQTGRLQLAYTPSHFMSQKKLAAHISEKSNAQSEVVAKSDLGAEIATDLYYGGILFPEHGALHPAKYHKGLLDAALRRSIPVVSYCPAIRFEREKTGHRIVTLKGPIRTDKVVLATNGYTGWPFKWFASRVFPVPSFLIATEPLSLNLISELAPGRRMMVETRARHSYFRVSPDGTRILFGGRASMVNINLAKAARRQRETMCEIWPSLRDVRLTHVWTGNTGFSFSHMPTVGEHDGFHYAMGYSGSGTVVAPYLGAKAAFRALGLPEGETAYARTKLRARWFYRGGRPHFLRPADLWYRNWIDRRETRASQR
jgi:glycine/D-amino acid oxidase-like deaminating enzyme